MATKAPRGLAPNASLPAKVESIPPNQTIYVTGLPSNKIQKADLNATLYTLFSGYGDILDVVALMTMKMRGQAHITFRDVPAATQALRSLDGQECLGKTMKIQYAKGKSNYVARLDGTFNIPNYKGAATVEQTALQQSIFNALPAASKGAPGTEQSSTDQPMKDADDTRGQKRARDEEEDDSDSDVAMEVDDDSE